jgi:hypothetical protein
MVAKKNTGQLSPTYIHYNLVRGNFLARPSNHLARQRFAGFLPLPAAGVAAGGWGILGSWLVYSVGLGRAPTGGAVEACGAAGVGFCVGSCPLRWWWSSELRREVLDFPTFQASRARE